MILRVCTGVMLALLSAGCATYTEAQMRLTEQARKGVEICRAAQAERSALLEQLQQSQRGRLNEAFDADVKAQPNLSSEWVIEHRKAYSIAVDALARQRAASAAAEAAAKENLAATDQALERLLHLQSLQLRLGVIEDLLGRPMTRPTSR